MEKRDLEREQAARCPGGPGQLLARARAYMCTLYTLPHVIILCVCVCVRARARVCVWYVCMYVCMYVIAHIYIYIYIYTAITCGEDIQ